MNHCTTEGTLKNTGAPLTAALEACAHACARIAPQWPLHDLIAVNPYWSYSDRPIREVAARMALLGNIQLFPSRDHYRQAWETQRITGNDLLMALRRLDYSDITEADCLDALTHPRALTTLPLLTDHIEGRAAQRPHLPWRDAITHQISQTCAAFFDHHFADWQGQRKNGLYAFWREMLQHDHGIAILMDLAPIRQDVITTLPTSWQETLYHGLSRLPLPRTAWPDYLEALLLTINGWASWCAGLRWRTHPSAEDTNPLAQLLTIRVAWEALLYDTLSPQQKRQIDAANRSLWSRVPDLIASNAKNLRLDEIWQLAWEISYQRNALHPLNRSRGIAFRAPNSDHRPEAQAIFCIDVRSERMRRHLEQLTPQIETIGFAGFFALPVAYQPLCAHVARPQLPGLLSPSATLVEKVIPPDRTSSDPFATKLAEGQIRAKLIGYLQTQLATRIPTTAFSFVEAFGWRYLSKLVSWVFPPTKARRVADQLALPNRYQKWIRPVFDDANDTMQKYELALKAVQALPLGLNPAPFVFLIGHGAQTTNNAHAAALECGACGGHSGEANARALALLLNDHKTRQYLAQHGHPIPEDTWFIAGLHNTTTDEVEWFDLDLLPLSIRERLNQFLPFFVEAGDRVRRERAPLLGIDPHQTAASLVKAFRRRANDGAQTRPEWGLAGNAAMIVAPRQRTQDTDFGGRVFLHDYDETNDPNGAQLEQILLGPLIVAHWINMQYYASVCDPKKMGSGNKVLHNVVGGSLGVFEGNGGNLRIGLPLQSVFDGQNWRHEPLRLTVVVHAPRERLTQIIAKHQTLQHLIDNEWIHLWHWADQEFTRYKGGAWFAVASSLACELSDSHNRSPQSHVRAANEPTHDREIDCQQTQPQR